MLSKLRTSNFFGGDIVRTERQTAQESMDLGSDELSEKHGKTSYHQMN